MHATFKPFVIATITIAVLSENKETPTDQLYPTL